jgi:predicted 2-oxoglutarate/Fe(II)-dependent dioxygenase YbiX
LEQTRYSDLGLFIIRGFLAADECERLRLEARSAETSPALVVKRNGVSLDEETRRTQCVCVPAASVAFVYERLMKLKPDLESHYGVGLGSCEQPQFLVYREGDFFVPHQDTGDHPDHPLDVRRREVSVVLFLNDQALHPGPDVFGGGSLTFFDLSEATTWSTCRVSVTGERGLLVAFPSGLFHQVMKIHHGERFTVVSWFPNGSSD